MKCNINFRPGAVTMLPTSLIIIAIALLMLWSPGVSAGENSFISAGSARTLGEEVTVPVTLRHFTRLASGDFTVTAPRSPAPIYLERVEFTSAFDGSDGSFFEAHSSQTGELLQVSFVSSRGNGHRVDYQVVCYLTYRLGPGLRRGESLQLELGGVTLKDQRGSLLPVTLYHGSVEKNNIPGDALGLGRPSAATAARLLQHAQGINPVTDKHILEAVDLTADGQVNSGDALRLLRYLAGLEDSLLCITTATLPPALLDQEYYYPLEAAWGSPPYTWSRTGGRLPAGLALDPGGAITGEATRAGESSFLLQVTDRYGRAAEKEFTLAVKETPAQDEGGSPPTPGGGPSPDPGYQGEAIKSITSSYMGLMGVHTITVEVSDQVSAVDLRGRVPDNRGRLVVADIPMHFEGSNLFSLATPRLKSGDTVTIIAHDYQGREMQQKEHKVE